MVTGASSGLDKATARLLFGQGASVVLGAWRVAHLTLLAAELFARAVAFAMSQPDDMDVNEIPRFPFQKK